MGIIIAIIIAIVLFYLIKVAIKANKSNVAVDPVSPHQKEIKENEVPIYKKVSPEEMQSARERRIQNQPIKTEIIDQTPSNAEGYFYYEMVGMYYNNVSPDDFGIYRGYAVAETNNPYDKYAVGIYRKGDNKLVGHTPRDFRGESNKILHERITEKGGTVEAVFKIQGGDSRTYGSVYIKLAEAHIEDKTECYKSPNLKRYSLQIDKEYVCKPGRFYGRAILGEQKDDSFPIFIIDEQQEKIGTISDSYHLFSTIAKYDNGNVPVWGYICVQYDTMGKEVYTAFVFIPAKCSDKKINEAISEFKAQKIKFKHN